MGGGVRRWIVGNKWRYRTLQNLYTSILARKSQVQSSERRTQKHLTAGAHLALSAVNCIQMVRHACWRFCILVILQGRGSASVLVVAVVKDGVLGEFDINFVTRRCSHN